MALGGKLLVNGPARQPMPHGLFSVLVPRSSTDPHWENGVTWEPLTCQPASGVGEVSCEAPEGTSVGWGLPKNFAEQPDGAEATPFTVYGSYDCSPIGHRLEYGEEQARQHLLAREEATAESIIWNGVGPGEPGATNPTLPNILNGAETLGDPDTAPVVGLALLEDFLAREYGSLGVIHMSRASATILSDYLVVSGNSLTTRLGTPVVAGAGYDTGGTGLIAATPALFGYRSDIFTASGRQGDLLDRGRNDLYAVAERRYVIGWDPCGTAAVDIAWECC